MKTKRIVALIMCALMSMSVFACSSGSDESTTTETTLDTAIVETAVLESQSETVQSVETSETSDLLSEDIEIPRGQVDEEVVTDFLSRIPDNWAVGEYQDVYSDEYVTISAMPLYVSSSAGDIHSVWPMIIWKTVNNSDTTIDVSSGADYMTDRGQTEGLNNVYTAYAEADMTVYTCTDFVTSEGGSGTYNDDGEIYMYDLINEVSLPIEICTYEEGSGYDTVVQAQPITVNFGVLSTPDYS